MAALTVIASVQGMKNPELPCHIPQWQIDQLEKVRAWASIDKKADGKVE